MDVSYGLYTMSILRILFQIKFVIMERITMDTKKVSKKYDRCLWPKIYVYSLTMRGRRLLSLRLLVLVLDKQMKQLQRQG